MQHCVFDECCGDIHCKSGGWVVILRICAFIGGEGGRGVFRGVVEE